MRPTATYRLTAADVGKTVLARVTATNPAGSESADSLESAAVAGLPVNAQLPAVTGVANDGETLTAQPGTWTGSPAPTVTREWLRCSGADVATLRGHGRDRHELRARARRRGLAPARARARREHRGPHGRDLGRHGGRHRRRAANDAPPTVTGTAKDGELLTAADGTWSGTPPAFARRWRRCDGAACADIAGATASTYRLTSEDVGRTIRVAVTATNAAGSAGAESAPTATSRRSPWPTRSPRR